MQQVSEQLQRQRSDHLCLGTVHQWLPFLMQPFLPPDHTTSALKVAVRHSPIWLVCHRSGITKRKRERQGWCTSICLTQCLSTSICLSFCVTLAVSVKIAPAHSLFLITWDCFYPQLLFLSSWFTVCLFLPLFASAYLSLLLHCF